MTRKRRLIHSALLYLLPILVVWFGFGLIAAAITVLLMLLLRWAVALSGIVAPEKTPELELQTMSASHFVEKVRWCMDRLGVEYTERQSAATLGVFFTGRTVPQLRVRTGIVQSVIGNSPDILRYLWGRYAALRPHEAAFLEPTPERLEFEKRIDRYGRGLQVWVYYHVLDDREVTLQAWGVNSPFVPRWQQLAVRLLFPLLAVLIRKSFAISAAQYSKAVQNIEELLGEVDAKLADGRRSILGGSTINYTDIAFAAISGLWLQPGDYGGGKAEGTRIERDSMPPGMRADIERWIEKHRLSAGYIESLYAEER